MTPSTPRTVEEELGEFFERLTITSPHHVRWDGLVHPAPELVDAVHSLLYATYYSRGPALARRGVWPLTMPPLDPRRSLEPVITRANASRDRWDPGWHVDRRHQDGRVRLHKGERVRLAHRTELATDAGPQTARLWAPRGRPSRTPGFSFVFGEELGDEADDASTMRLYFHVPATAAAALVETVSRGLNHYQVPFRFKILNHPELYPRADAAVLYVARQCFAIVAQILELASRHSWPALRPEVPLFTKLHRPGIGIADDTGTHESFGSLRCRLVAEAIVELWRRGLQDPAHRLERTRQRFREEGLDLDHPHLAPGLADFASPVALPSEPGGRAGLPPHSASTYLETADRIGRRLCRDAVWDDDQCTWLGWSMEPGAGAWQPVRCTAGVEPYAGTSGIGLFLARLWQQTRDPIERTAAEGAARRADEGAAALDGPAAMGLHAGLLGLGSSLIEIGTALDDERWVARGLAHVRRAAAIPCDPQALDVIGGSAGMIPVLIDLGHRFREPALLEAAVRHAKLLCERAIHHERGWAWDTLPGLGEPPLLGYSHGVAGVVVALLEVAVLTGDPGLVTAAREGLRYERSYFRPAEDNWPDLRTFDAPPQPRPSCMTAWCHGAPGIGLARLRTDALLGGDAEVRAEIAAAVRATTASLAGGSDRSLCHGSFGNAELLLEVARRWGRPDVCTPALVAADRAIATIEAARRPWPCGVQGAGETPGLMIGTAGIGHHYLRLADPRVPSVLLPWPAAPR